MTGDNCAMVQLCDWKVGLGADCGSRGKVRLMSGCSQEQTFKIDFIDALTATGDAAIGTNHGSSFQ